MIVVTGGSGRLGTALKAHLPNASYPSSSVLEITSPNNVQRYFLEHKPTLVIHLAAETQAWAPPYNYLKTNVQGTAILAEWAIMGNARMVYTSTDYVYPGVTGNYSEGDPVSPIGRYAASKLAGEYAVACVPDHLIIRGSWYTTLTHRQSPTDAFTSKLHVDDAAPLIAQLAQSATMGIVNIGGPRRSLYDIVRHDYPAVEAVSRHDLHDGPYRIPADVSLNTSKLGRLLLG